MVQRVTLPDTTVSAASVTEQRPGSGRGLVEGPVSSLPVTVQVLRPLTRAGQHAEVGGLGHHVHAGHRHGVLRLASVVQPRGQHRGVHGLGHQVRVAVHQVLAVQGRGQLHLVASRRNNRHLLWRGTGP